MVRYGMVIDTTKCTGCSVCFGACKDEFVGNDYPAGSNGTGTGATYYSKAQPDAQYGYYGGAPAANGTGNGSAWVIPGQTWMKDVQVVSGTSPNLQSRFVYEPCMQCSNAPCIAAATGGAVSARPDGIVLIDPVKSVGQKNIMSACPYGRIYWNSTLNIPQKCTFCAHRIDNGQNPKCVDACPMSAITFGDLDASTSPIAAVVGQSSVLHPEYNLKTAVTYIGLITGTEEK